MSKKVLIICYYWPPAGGPGVQRWLKFVKYLPQFDINPVVYVPENPKYPIGIVPKQTKQTLVQKLMLYIRGNFFIPDARIGWVKPSVKYLKTYIQKHQIETIITTGPPHSLHLIGMQLKTKIEEEDSTRIIKWIADFRDPWTTIGYHNKLKMTLKSKQEHKKLEYNVLTTADTVIVTSPTTKKEFEAITKQPIAVITNGFDTEQPEKAIIPTRFILSHIGSLLSDRNPIVLWKVLSKLVSTNEVFKNSFRLRLAGKISQEVIDTIGTYDLTSYVDNIGYVSHEEAIQLQREAAVLLLIEIDAEITKGIIPGKVFEYLSAQRPILGIGPKDADVEEIISSTHSGHYITYEEEDKLEQLILQLFENYKSPHWNDRGDAFSKYHRKELTSTLATLIKNVS